MPNSGETAEIMSSVVSVQTALAIIHLQVVVG